MMTVLHKTELGADVFYEAHEVNKAVEGPMTIYRPDATDEPVLLTSGVAYVMNHNGATVGKYDLGRVSS